MAGQIAEKIVTQDKLFRKFKKIIVGQILQPEKEARNTGQALVKDKKKNFCKKSYLKIQENQKNSGKLLKMGETKRLPQQTCLNMKKYLIFSYPWRSLTLSSVFKEYCKSASNLGTVKRGNFDRFWRVLESFENMLLHTSPSY